ncbi:MAG: hypothetical protein AB1782_03135 [Cyanobacteriota bacterium]
MSQIDKYSTFLNMLTSVRALPAWVLQGIYIEISGLLKDRGAEINAQKIDRTDLLQLYIPVLNPVGKKMLEEDSRERRLGSIDPDILSFLQNAKIKRNIIDICLINKWTLEKCCHVMLECIRNNYLERTYTPNMHTTLMFITGNLKVGEFLTRKGFITQSQLEWALQVQGDIDGTFDEKNKIVEVLTNLGYLEKDLISDFLSLKEFAKAQFEINDNTKPLLDIITEQDTENIDLKNQLEEQGKELLSVDKERKILENKLKDLRENFDTIHKKNLELSQELEQYQKKFGLFNKL